MTPLPSQNRRTRSRAVRWSVALAAAAITVTSFAAPPASAGEPVGDGTVALPSAAGVTAVAVPVTGPDARPLASPRVAVKTGTGRATTEAVPGFQATVSVPEGQMVAVDWRDAPGGALELRAQANGIWGEWVELEHDASAGPDVGTREASVVRPTSAGPVWTGSGTEAVQVRVTSGRLADLRVNVLRTDGAPTTTTASTTTARAAGPAMPAIQPRSAWGAGPWACGGSPSTAPLRNAIVHHTASGNAYSESEVDDVLRGIYYFHTQTRGWCDIAYNFLVDRFGGMWEGRTGSLANPVIGGHAKGFNTGSVGVSVLGNYEGVTLPSAAFTGLRKIVGWRLGSAGIDPEGKVTIESAGSTRYSAGTMVTLPVISPHSDTSLTTCAGTGINNRLPELRTLVGDDVAAPTADTNPPAPVGAWAIAGNGQANVMWPSVTTSSTKLTAYIVTVSPGGRRLMVAAVDNRLIVPGLPNGVAHRFTVASVDASGIGPDSLPTSSVAPSRTAPFFTTVAFVRQVYTDFLGRLPSSSELTAARSDIDSGRVGRSEFLEGVMRNQRWAGVYEPVGRLYFAYFRRLPDASGMDYWAGRYRSGWSLSSISDSFAASTEFRATYGTLSNEQFVKLVYSNVLGRTADQAGLTYWTGQLAAGRTRGFVMIGFSESAEYRTKMANEMSVVMLWRGMLTTMPTSTRFASSVARLDAGTPLATITEELLIDPAYVARITR